MNNIEQILSNSIKNLISNSSTQKKIKALEEKHINKLHFIPSKYRIFGGILQSMNIQFGNFLEKVMQEVVKDNPENEIIKEYSGKKGCTFKLSKKSDAMIDAYISSCQYNYFKEEELEKKFLFLLEQIKENEFDFNNEFDTIKHDVDLLFKNKKTETYYYVEIKYNDDHDTGKFVDINRKLLKTYAYLQRELGKEVTLCPILFYFNNKKMKGNIYLPENIAICRGEKFFEKFTNIKYEFMYTYLKNVSENPDTIRTFDELYKKIIK